MCSELSELSVGKRVFLWSSLINEIRKLSVTVDPRLPLWLDLRLPILAKRALVGNLLQLLVSVSSSTPSLPSERLSKETTVTTTHVHSL